MVWAAGVMVWAAGVVIWVAMVVWAAVSLFAGPLRVVVWAVLFLFQPGGRHFYPGQEVEQVFLGGEGGFLFRSGMRDSVQESSC